MDGRTDTSLLTLINLSWLWLTLIDLYWPYLIKWPTKKASTFYLFCHFSQFQSFLSFFTILRPCMPLVDHCTPFLSLFVGSWSDKYLDKINIEQNIGFFLWISFVFLSTLSVWPSVHPSLGQSIHRSVDLSHVIFANFGLIKLSKGLVKFRLTLVDYAWP